MYAHSDGLARLNEEISLREKLDHVHQVLAARHPFVDRIAVALYEPETDMLRMLVASGGALLQHYEAELAKCGSLRQVLAKRRPRVINDLNVFAYNSQPHSERVEAGGFRSSYTMPMFLNSNFFGFVFFDSREPAAFVEPALFDLDLFGHIITLLVVGEVTSIRTLLGAIRTAREMTRHRDAETGAHVDRMARFARLIAVELADQHGFDDEYIQQVFAYAPLHDLGKIAIADEILLKPGRLTPDETFEMKTHVARGQEMVDSMLDNFGLDGVTHVDVLRNIVGCHHERPDGRGYPEGLHEDAIPIEARIVAVADVFDALTSPRPYRQPVDNQQAFADLGRLAGDALDRDCVEALIRRANDVARIQLQFRERAAV